MKAVIDRIEGETALVLFEEQGLELPVPLSVLPNDVREGSWLDVHFTLNAALTSEMYRKNKSLLEKLIKKGRQR